MDVTVLHKEKIFEHISKTLPEKRFIHTVEVMETAVSLAKEYDLDQDKAAIAALLHDCAKAYTKEQLLKKLLASGIIFNDFDLDYPEIWHALVAPIIAKDDYGIDDLEIHSAIMKHTTGSEDMTLFDKIIYLADYIEPGRKFHGVKQLRYLVKTDINEAMLYAFDLTIKHLIKEKKLVHPVTLAARNYLLLNRKGLANERSIAETTKI